MAELNLTALSNAAFNSISGAEQEAAAPGFLNTVLINGITYGDILGAVIVLFGTLIISRVLSGIVNRMFSGKVEKNNVIFMQKLTRWIVYFIGFLVMSPLLSIDFSGLMVAGGIVAVAIGFASQSTLSNFVAGLLLMFERPVGISDNIKINGTQGYVEDIGLMSTTIRTYEGIYVRIPNGTMFTSDITNYVAHVARRFQYNVSIRYSDDAAKAIEIIKDVINKHPYALKKPSPDVYVDDLGAHGVQLIVRIWSPSGYWWDARTSLLWKIFKALRAADIDIPFEQLVIWEGKDTVASQDHDVSEDFVYAEDPAPPKKNRDDPKKQMVPE